MSESNESARVVQIDQWVSHVWMVRTFLKHCDEAEEDDELLEVHRALYDFMLALGGQDETNNPATYLKTAKKKFKKLRTANQLFLEIQPEISNHTNFRMAARSLNHAIQQIESLINQTD